MAEEEVLARLREDIQNYGWGLLTTDYKGHQFCHTIGLHWTFQHSDFEMVGLNEELATLFLNELAMRVKEGKKFQHLAVIDDMVENTELMLVHNPIDPEGEPVLNGRLRLIYPDSQHRYPWEAGCDEDCLVQLLFPDSTIPNRELLEAEGLLLHTVSH
ncbi:MAG: DUF4262 domain-containing protein [bacterium]|jgi:hypothetical protein